MNEQAAIEAALEAYRQPQAFHLSRRRPLPPGMPALLKLVSAAPEEISSIVTTETAEKFPVRDAAVFYLQHVLIKADDDYRQLALDPGASLQEVKDHKRLLLKWLHPDRNHNRWESGLFQRVTTSAERLENALRSGSSVQPAYPAERRKHRRKEGSWSVAQRRVKKPVGLKVRLFKIAVAVAVVILLVALAQLGLDAVQSGQLRWVQSGLRLDQAEFSSPVRNTA